VAAILATLRCIEARNASCAAAGYDATRFVKLHNDVNTNTSLDDDDDGQFWTRAFALVSFRLNISDARNVGPNVAHLRYVETATFTDGASLGLVPSSTYPFHQTHVQHEDAFVETDNACKIVRWDQYGDDAEQAGVASNAADLLCELGVPPPSGASCETNNVTTNGPDGQQQPEQEKEPQQQPSSRAPAKAVLASTFRLVSVLLGSALAVAAAAAP
jgi:hypothetical protein